MGATSPSEDTDLLELKSLQLDIKALQNAREEDRAEFFEYSQQVKSNFITIQENLASLQASLNRFFAPNNKSSTPTAAEKRQLNAELTPGQGSSVQQNPPHGPGNVVNPVGTSVLQDN